MINKENNQPKEKVYDNSCSDQINIQFCDMFTHLANLPDSFKVFQPLVPKNIDKEFADKCNFEMPKGQNRILSFGQKKEDKTETGQKFSKNKLDMGKLFTQFPNACQAIILASHFGHEKYKKSDCPETWSNFKNVPNAEKEYKAASVRHEFETIDSEESGIDPIFHQLWNKIAETEMYIKNKNISIKKLAEEKLPIWREQFGY